MRKTKDGFDALVGRIQPTFLPGPVFVLASMKNYRKFYQVYPELAEPVAGYLLSRFGKSQSLISQLANGIGDAAAKSQTVSGLSDGSEILVCSSGDVVVNPFARKARKETQRQDLSRRRGGTEWRNMRWI